MSDFRVSAEQEQLIQDAMNDLQNLAANLPPAFDIYFYMKNIEEKLVISHASSEVTEALKDKFKRLKNKLLSETNVVEITRNDGTYFVIDLTDVVAIEVL